MDNLMAYTLWLVLNDEEFLRTNNVQPTVFPRGSTSFLAELALNHWRDNQSILSDATIDLATEQDTVAMRRHRATPDNICEAYVDLCVRYAIKPTALRDARKRCREWLEQRAIEATLARAQRSLASGDRLAARAHLTSPSGVAVNAGANAAHISLASSNFLVRTPLPGAIPTGFPILDAAWDGGYRPGTLGMVAAATGVGKSMALCYMSAEAYWAGANVLYYTFELSTEQIQERIATAILGKTKSLITGDWDRELWTASKLRYLNSPPPADIDIRSEPGTWPEIWADLESYKQDWGQYPDVLMLDSADDVAPLKALDNNATELKNTFVWLRSEAARKGLRIWTSAQLTRDAVEKAMVSLKHIGSAYAKAQKSHFVFGLTQTDGQRADVDGPKMSMYILKDSLYGTAHRSLECKVEYGNGKDGFPGFTVLQTGGF